MPTRGRKFRTPRNTRLARRLAAREAFLLDPANVLSDEAWREHGPCEAGPEGCDGGGFCDGHCHYRPLVSGRNEREFT